MCGERARGAAAREVHARARARAAHRVRALRVHPARCFRRLKQSI